MTVEIDALSLPRRNSRRYRRLSVAVRAAAGLSGTPYPIKVVHSADPPRLTGRSYYWTTPSGKTIVRYPNAYGWPTLYHPSTLTVEVGALWLLERKLF